MNPNAQVPLRRPALTALLLAGLLLAAVGCETLTEPVTGRKQYMLPQSLTGSDATLGAQAWQDVVQKEKPTTDPAKTAIVEQVGRNIAAVTNAPGYQWEFKVFSSTEANAFCLPGGKVAVYEGLFPCIQNEAELAVVMGHEVAHAIARHGAERMSQQMAAGFGATALGAVLDYKKMDAQQKGLWLQAYTGASTLGVLLPYSRTQETSADQIGLMYLARAGYDPHAAITFWTRFAATKADGGAAGLGEYTSTHPADANRIKHLQTLLPAALAEYEKAPVKRGLGKTLR